MRKLVAMLAGAAALAISAAPVTAQNVYQEPGTYSSAGRTTYGPGGSTQQQVGNTTYVHGPNGSTSFNHVGNTTYGSNGTSFNHVGNTTYGSNGTTSQTVGNTTYIRGSNGQNATCQHVGAQTYCH